MKRKFKLYLFLIIIILNFKSSIQAQNEINLNWEVGHHKGINDKPQKWYASKVPGAPHLDIMKGEKYKQPIWYADNVKQFLWMEDVFFTYKTNFKKPTVQPGQKIFFHSKGIDYEFSIFLNGEKIHSQEGMFSYVDLDITDKLKDNNELLITLLPPKKPGSYRKGDALNVSGFFRDNARTSVKPPVSYGWDWHPRLISRGIWDETYLSVRNAVRINDAEVRYSLDSSLSTANIKLDVNGENLSGAQYVWTLKDPNGKEVISKKGKFDGNKTQLTEKLSNVRLWWPNGYGKPELYQSSLQLLKDGAVTDTEESKVGFRQVKIVMGEGTWVEPTIFPKSRSVSPATFEVNGKVIFAKGSNWVPQELFPGLQVKENYEPYIKLAKEANFNILRAWGGAIVNKESFFDLCDEYGMMVWQEFPLTGTLYPEDESYISILKQESEAIIKRVRRHACLSLWSGGNELFNEWSGMTEQSAAMRLLNSQCYLLDPQTPFIFTSPLEGMGHGHYVFWDPKNGGEVFQWMPKGKNKYTAYTEFGVPSVASVDVLKTIIPANELFPPKPGTSWETHHAFGVWGINRWIELPFLEKYFGKFTTLEDLVKKSQLTQSEGYKCIFEESRRQKPFCGMAVNWCFQEPWPTAANNSLISWPVKPKPSFYAVANACRPVLVSGRFAKFAWTKGENFTCELFMLNDSYEKLPPMQVNVKLVYDGNKEINFLKWDFPGSEENANYQGPTALIPLPDMNSSEFMIKLEVPSNPKYNSEYTFLFAKPDKQKVKYLNGIAE